LESLLRTVGEHLGVSAGFHDEVRDVERRVRPDYGVSVAGAISGYVEVKAPEHPLDPSKPESTDDLKSRQASTQVKPLLSLPSGCTW